MLRVKTPVGKQKDNVSMTTLIFLLFVLNSVFCNEGNREALKKQVSKDAIKARNDLENMEEAVDEYIDNLEKSNKDATSKPNFLEQLKKKLAQEIEKCDCGYLARQENLKVVITVMSIIFILLIIANAIILFILFSKAKKTW